ncbi:MAG: CRISPR-associated endonuclease Cas1, partial [Thermoprotei archaeon]
KTWIAQIVASKRRRLEFAKAFAEGKVYNQRNVLYQLSRKYSRMGGKYRSVRAVIRQAIDSATLALRDIKEAQNVKEVRSAEAHAAKEYWEAVASVLPEELGFKRRLKRYSLPKDEEPDPFNKALNIGYAALLREVWRAIFLTGLNPYYGFLHVKRPGRMSLVLDLMEEFRPIAVDRPLITLSLKDKDVIVGLERDSKEAVAKVWGVVIDVLNNPPRPLKELVLSQARRLARSILERKPYTPYKSTW